MTSLLRASAARAIARPAARAFSRHGTQNPVLNGMLKNNAGYVTFIIGSAVAAEFVFGKGTYAVFSALNKGKLYEHIDWSKFEEEDDDDEDW